MLIGVFIRNYKVYDQLFFIPLATGRNLSGLLGENGVGKTTILNALDTFFNRRPWQKNIRNQLSRTNDSLIQPVFMIADEKIPDTLKSEAKRMDKYLRNFCTREKEKIIEQPYLSYFRNFMVSVPELKIQNGHSLLTVGIDNKDEAVNLIFPELDISADTWLTYLRTLYHYTFIPTTPEPGVVFANSKNRTREESEQALHTLAKEMFSIENPELLDASEKLELIVAYLKERLTGLKDQEHLIGFDEPEATLQTSACYDLFEKIYKLGENKVQILITSHWYGFIPLLTEGLLINIVRQNRKTYFLRFDISRYREEIKIRKKVFKEKYHQELPVDIELKSVNDFIQSVLGSVINKPFYNWLICEGSSEKIYFNYYFEELIRNENLRIVPVGGVREVKKIYSYLSTPFSDLREYIQSKVVLLTDTDTQLLEFDTHAIHNLFCFRLVNHRGKTELVHMRSNPKSPDTEIEDVLNGKVFHKTLLYFKEYYPQFLDFITEDPRPETPSYYSLDLTPSQREKLTAFFDHHHQIKTGFANKYIEICKQGNYKEPEWITELKHLFQNPDFDRADYRQDL